MQQPILLVATQDRILRIDPGAGVVEEAEGLDASLPGAVAWDPWAAERAWCGTLEGRVFRSEDGGRSWRSVSPGMGSVMAVSPSPAREDLVWVGTEPSAVWRSEDGGERWREVRGLEDLPSASEWSFPPRPETHHVRWIACHPSLEGRLWVAIEAGALIRTARGGEPWEDRVPRGPRDTHELDIHPSRPEHLRVAAGDGYFESLDGGTTWARPMGGLEVSYMRSVTVAPDDDTLVVVSGASRPRTAYAAGHSDGRVYRRVGEGHWDRVTEGWPDPPSTIAPLLRRGARGGELWAADERGIHRSGDGGIHWDQIIEFIPAPRHLRGFCVQG